MNDDHKMDESTNPDNESEVTQEPDNESEVTQEMEQELTDEQLLQMAEGSCTWGANCHG